MIRQNIKIELIHSGGSLHENYQALGFYALPLLHPWPTKPQPAERGEYRWSLYNRSGELVASDGFTPLFGEWQSTLRHDDVETQQNFRECLIVPDVAEGQVLIERRGTLPAWRRIGVITLPEQEETDQIFLPRGVQVHKLHEGAEPAKALNIILISEGYGYKDQDLFLDDARRASDLLLTAQPYAEHAAHLNVTALLKPVRFGGIPLDQDEDATNTNFDTSFGALGRDRLIAVRDPHAMFEAIGTEPCDAVIVLCNSEKYGTCSLFRQHCAIPARSEPGMFETLLLQSFSQSLAGLADESFDPDTNCSPEALQLSPPWEPNISTLKHGEVKWQSRIEKGVPVPTPWRRNDYGQKAEAALNDPHSHEWGELAAFLKSEPYYGKLGAFEGARRSATGIYRPELECRMASPAARQFCTICRDAISAEIRRIIGGN